MTKFADKFEPLDIVAIVMIIGCFVTYMIKPDPMFKDVLLSVGSFYSGYKVVKQKS